MTGSSQDTNESEKVEEFINLCQGYMSVLEYSLKFTKFSKYASYLVSSPIDEMNHFCDGIVR